jgi:hypothetical protein
MGQLSSTCVQPPTASQHARTLWSSLAMLASITLPIAVYAMAITANGSMVITLGLSSADAPCV